MLPTFPDFMRNYKDNETYMEVADQYFEFGSYLRSLLPGSQLEGMIYSFKNLSSAAKAELIIEEIQVPPDPEDSECSDEINRVDAILSYEYDDSIDKDIIDAAFDIAKDGQRVLLSQMNGNENYEDILKESRLLGAFILGLGVGPKEHMNQFLYIALTGHKEYLN